MSMEPSIREIRINELKYICTYIVWAANSKLLGTKILGTKILELPKPFRVQT